LSACTSARRVLYVFPIVCVN